MAGESGSQEAGEASSSTRAGRTTRVATLGAGPLVRLPEDGVAVEWWLARRAVEADGEMPYSSDGVLALWPQHRAVTDAWTFGLEFEFAAADADWVASELHARGLTASPSPVIYHGERVEGFWTVEQDSSVTSVFTGPEGTIPIVVGGEVISPPLRDTPETWRQVAAVLEVLRACGAEVNRNCGFHVHVGASALLDPGQHHAGGDPTLRAAHEPDRDLLPALSRLAMLASVCFEDLVFRLASAEGGRHRGRAFFYRHSRPLERPLLAAYDTVADLANALGKEGAARRAALNLTNVGDPNKDTVEFRQCNGTLDPRIVQAFCRLCVALVGAARWQPEAARLAPEPLGSHWKAEHDAGQVHDVDPAPLWRFLGAAFPQGVPVEAAASLLWLYRRASWQPSLAALASA